MYTKVLIDDHLNSNANNVQTIGLNYQLTCSKVAPLCLITKQEPSNWFLAQQIIKVFQQQHAVGHAN